MFEEGSQSRGCLNWEEEAKGSQRHMYSGYKERSKTRVSLLGNKEEYMFLFFVILLIIIKLT